MSLRLSWAQRADSVLAQLFVRGQPVPTALELRDAYPFGLRAHHPYKVWLARVKAFRLEHEKLRVFEGDAAPDVRESHPDTPSIESGENAGNHQQTANVDLDA